MFALRATVTNMKDGSVMNEAVRFVESESEAEEAKGSDFGHDFEDAEVEIFDLKRGGDLEEFCSSITPFKTFAGVDDTADEEE